MYSQHFHLNQRPFAGDPGSDFVVPNEAVAQVTKRLQDAFMSRDAVVVVSGGPGVGKTALVEHARSSLGEDAVVAWADMRQAEPEQLFDLLILGLGGQVGDGSGPVSLSRLRQLLVEHHNAGRHVTAAIDVTGITAERAKRLLRLVHMTAEPGVQLNIILMGPHTLHKLLDVPGLIHIRQRVTLRHRVRPLSEAETRSYIADRLSLSGGNPAELLADDVPALVYRYVAGVPRLINTLMEAALTEAAATDATAVNANMVNMVAQGLGWRPMGSAQPAARPAARKLASPLELAARSQTKAATPAPAAAALDSAPSEMTSALLVSDLKLDADTSAGNQAEANDKPSVPDRKFRTGDAGSGVPEMNAMDTGATGMLKLEDLDERFAETVFGDD